MQIIDPPETLFTHFEKGQRVLGLDLGSKTIGLALSDTEYKIASPFETIRRKKFTSDADVLHNIIVGQNIGGLVIGLPLNMDGSQGARAQATHAFLRNLSQLADFPSLPAILWDERLSTAAVTRTLIEADASRARRAELVDKLAAAYILQGYLDFYHNR